MGLFTVARVFDCACRQTDRRRVWLIKCLLHSAQPDKFVSESAVIMNCERNVCNDARNQTDSWQILSKGNNSLHNLQGRWNMSVHIPTADDHVCLGGRIKRLMYLFPLWPTNLPICGRLWWFSTDAPTACGFCKEKIEDLAARAREGSCSAGLQDLHWQSASVDSSWTRFLRRGNKRKTQTIGWLKKRKVTFLPAFRDKAGLKFARRKTESCVWRCWRPLSRWVQLQDVSRRCAGRFYWKS